MVTITPIASILLCVVFVILSNPIPFLPHLLLPSSSSSVHLRYPAVLSYPLQSNPPLPLANPVPLQVPAYRQGRVVTATSVSANSHLIKKVLICTGGFSSSSIVKITMGSRKERRLKSRMERDLGREIWDRTRRQIRKRLRMELKKRMNFYNLQKVVCKDM